MIGKIIAVLALLALVIGGLFFWQKSQVKPVPTEVSWEECIKSPGAVIMESYPEKCLAPDGRHATKPID